MRSVWTIAVSHAHWTISSHNLGPKVVFLFQSFLVIPGNIFTAIMCRWRSCRVNNSGLYMFAIGLSETKCLQGWLYVIWKLSSQIRVVFNQFWCSRTYRTIDFFLRELKILKLNVHCFISAYRAFSIILEFLLDSNQ